MYDKEIEQEIQGDSLNDCRKKLYDLYEDSYDIIGKRASVKHGFLGFGRKPVVIVKYVVKDRTKYNPPVNDFLRRSVEASQAMAKEEKLLQSNKEAILNKNSSVLINAQINKLDQVQNKLDELASSVNKINNMNPETPESISKIENLLEQNEFSFSYIQMITNKIRQTFSIAQLEDFDLIERTVIDWIGETIHIATPKTYRPPHVVIIVGPTGVGKTTTLVKLVAREIVESRKRDRIFDVRLITTDITRVGAMEQLEHYGSALKREVLKAENVNDLKTLFDENKDHCDAIYIDTSGYSPNDSTHIGQMKAMLDVPGLSPEVFLAFDAKTKCNDISNIMKNYEPFGYSSVIVTKCDESGEYGNVISKLYEHRKSVSFVTDGQNAARNLIQADVIFFLTRLKGFNVDREHIEQKFNNKEEL